MMNESVEKDFENNDFYYLMDLMVRSPMQIEALKQMGISLNEESILKLQKRDYKRALYNE